MPQKNRLTCDELGSILEKHLKGTALEPIARNHNYVTDVTGFVARETIDRLCGIFQQTIEIYEQHISHRKNVSRQVWAIRKAVETIQPFGTMSILPPPGTN